MENQLPLVSTIFDNEERDSDSRGSILSIVDHQIKNVSIIVIGFAISSLLVNNPKIKKYKQ